MPSTYANFPISGAAKIALAAIEDNSFLKKTRPELETMRRDLRLTPYENLNAEHVRMLVQGIAAIGDELNTRYQRWTNGWLITLAALATFLALANLAWSIWSSCQHR